MIRSTAGRGWRNRGDREMFNNARDVRFSLGRAGRAHAWSAGTILLVSTDLAAIGSRHDDRLSQPVEIARAASFP